MNYDLLILGMISLAQNSFMAAVPAEARRKSRVILWGTLAGVLPIVLGRAISDFTGYRPSFWLDTALVLVLLLYPLSFAYAVVKHRVMELPVLLRRSARYVLVQRGFIVLMFIVAASAIGLFTHVFSRFVRAYTNIGMALSAVFGIVLVWTSAPLVKRGTVRIDRAFFRSAYDSRIILHDLAEKTRTVGDRRQLAALLERHVSEALHPKTFACYFESGNDRLAAISGTFPATLETLSASAPVFVELARRGKAWEVRSGSAGAEELAALAPLAPECLVPILGRENNLIGMLVLGQRLSEEPYSGEDKRLLDSVAAHAGIALENIRLAEKMAERMEADRRIAQEMEFARQVQARLFPQKLPTMKTLEYTGGLHPGSEGGWGLLRLSGASPRPLGAGAGGHRGQRRIRRSADGQSASQLAQSIRDGGRRPAATACLGQPLVLREHRRCQLRYLILCGLRRLQPQTPLRELWASSPTPAARRRKLAGSTVEGAEGGVAAFHLHRDGIV